MLKKYCVPGISRRLRYVALPALINGQRAILFRCKRCDDSPSTHLGLPFSGAPPY